MFETVEMDEAADVMAIAAMSALPERMAHFMSPEKISEIQDEVFERVRLFLLFDALAHLVDKPIGNKCSECGKSFCYCQRL